MPNQTWNLPISRFSSEPLETRQTKSSRDTMGWMFKGKAAGPGKDRTSVNSATAIFDHTRQGSDNQIVAQNNSITSHYRPESSSTLQKMGYIPQSGPGYDMTLVAPNQITPIEMLGDLPQRIHCPFCQTESLTKLAQVGSILQV